MQDWNMELPVDIMIDATAGVGIASRRGVGKVRHLHAPLLWVQKIVEDRIVALKKIPRDVNVADLPTGHRGPQDMWSHLKGMRFEKRDGSSKLALKAAV